MIFIGQFSCLNAKQANFSAHAGFEKVLVDTISNRFPNALIVGFLFHFKQAIGRHMKNRHHSGIDSDGNGGKMCGFVNYHS